jgi:TonB family protein
MLQQTTTRQVETSRANAAHANDRSRLLLSLVLLLVALGVLVVKDRDFWFSDANAAVADETTPEWIPGSVAKTSPTPAPKASVQVAAKSSVGTVIAARHIVPASSNTTQPAVVPPLEVEVIAGDARDTVHVGGNSVKVTTPSRATRAAEAGPATVAAERVQMASVKVPAQQSPDSSYPLLGRQMKVQGSVLLQAFIGADGVIRDLRVLSGPAILATAAQEAARRWQFKPYLQNGQAVETQAKITVNFTIKVLDNGARDQMDTVVALSSRGE